MKINPMLKKEIKLSVRTSKLSVILMIFNSILMVMGMVAIFLIRENSIWSGNIKYRDNIYLYMFLSACEFVLLLFIMPTLSAGLISSEREKQTLDLLLASTMKPWQIILGKLESVIGIVLMIIVSGLPPIALVSIFGGITFGDIVKTVLYLVFAALLIGSIGTFCSSVVKKTTWASLLTYGVELGIIAGTFFIIYIIAYIRQVESQYMYTNIGAVSVLLLLNPAVTLACILFGRVASLATLTSWFTDLGMPVFVADHFLELSVLVQSVIIIIFIVLATHFLTDRGRKNKKHQKEIAA